jgi:hypothetical protein
VFSLVQKRKRDWHTFKVAILVLAVIIILDDEPTVWDKTLRLTERVLFGGLFSD